MTKNCSSRLVTTASTLTACAVIAACAVGNDSEIERGNGASSQGGSSGAGTGVDGSGTGAASNLGGDGPSGSGGSESGSGGANPGSGGSNDGSGGTNPGTGGSDTASGGSPPEKDPECIPAGSKCDNPNLQFRSPGTIIDFETEAPGHTRVQAPGAGTWFKITPDGDAGNQNNPIAIEGGANGTAWAAKWTVVGLDQKGEHGPSLNLLWDNCFEVAVTDGLSFWAKTSHPMNVRVYLRIPSTSQSNGDCTNNCPGDPEFTLSTTTEWKKFSIGWEQFADPAQGTTFKSLTECFLVVAVRWQLEEKARDVTLWLDEIALE